MESVASALIVPVPVAEPIIAPWRRLFDPASNQGVPAHVTLLYPFLPPAEIDEGVLARLAEITRRFEPFPFTLTQTERYPGLLVLPPEPAAPFLALREALIEAWPAIVPYEGRYGLRPPMHVTVAWSEAFKAGGCPDFAPIERALAPMLPVSGRATEVTLEIKRGERWSQDLRLPLGQSDSHQEV